MLLERKHTKQAKLCLAKEVNNLLFCWKLKKPQIANRRHIRCSSAKITLPKIQAPDFHEGSVAVCIESIGRFFIFLTFHLPDGPTTWPVSSERIRLWCLMPGTSQYQEGASVKCKCLYWWLWPQLQGRESCYLILSSPNVKSCKYRPPDGIRSDVSFTCLRVKSNYRTADCLSVYLTQNNRERRAEIKATEILFINPFKTRSYSEYKNSKTLFSMATQRSWVWPQGTHILVENV